MIVQYVIIAILAVLAVLVLLRKFKTAFYSTSSCDSDCDCEVSKLKKEGKF